MNHLIFYNFGKVGNNKCPTKFPYKVMYLHLKRCDQKISPQVVEGQLVAEISTFKSYFTTLKVVEFIIILSQIFLID